MKKKIYGFLNNNENSSIHEIANELKLPEPDVLKTVQELKDEHYICMTVLPLENEIKNANSCFYSVINKNIEYAE